MDKVKKVLRYLIALVGLTQIITGFSSLLAQEYTGNKIGIALNMATWGAIVSSVMYYERRSNNVKKNKIEKSIIQANNSTISTGKGLLIALGFVIVIVLIGLLVSGDNSPISKNSNSDKQSSENRTSPDSSRRDQSKVEIASGDIYNEINSRRSSMGLKPLEYSAVLQNIAQNLAIFNYQNPSLPISKTVLEEYFNGQEYYPSQSAFQALTESDCYSNSKTMVDRWYASSNNYIEQNFTEIGLYVGIDDNNTCSIFLTLATP